MLGSGLAGCSAHPGAGDWAAVDAGQTPFSKVLVHFEGRAELFDSKSGAESHHCFWGGKSATEIQLDCTTPQDTETRIHFSLNVDKEGSAKLIKDGAVIGLYKRMP